MTYDIVSVACGGPGLNLPLLNKPGFDFARTIDNRDNQLSPCQAYQQLLESSKSEILIYVHDDVTIHDPNWLDSILSVFQDAAENYTDTVAVGLGGATSLGRPDLYRKPYNIWNMARGGYASNQTDAEVHGERFTGVRRVAVLDAFCMAVRRSWLVRRDGWPTCYLTHHCLDLWLACEAARDHKEIWMVGASCTHHGGGSSIGAKYKEAKWLRGGSLEEDHARPHRWLAEEYRDVLPIRV